MSNTPEPIIPDFVINGWKDQYNEGSELWTKYPEVDPDKIMELVEADSPIVESICFRDAVKPEGMKPIYLATAGAPCAGKSTVLDQYIAENPDLHSYAVKVDPDRWAMLFMPNTYHGHLMSAGMVANAPDFAAAQIRAYDVARPASNYLTNEVFNKAVQLGYDVVHGTTMTSPFAGDLLTKMKNAGYNTQLLIVGASDDVRTAAAENRTVNQGFYQATAEDIADKGEAYALRMEDYFTHTDEITLFWRESATGNAVKAATYKHGQLLSVDNADAFDAFKDHYEQEKQKHANGTYKEVTELKSFDKIEEIYKKWASWR